MEWTIAWIGRGIGRLSHAGPEPTEPDGALYLEIVFEDQLLTLCLPVQAGSVALDEAFHVHRIRGLPGEMTTFAEWARSFVHVPALELVLDASSLLSERDETPQVRMRRRRAADTGGPPELRWTRPPWELTLDATLFGKLREPRIVVLPPAFAEFSLRGSLVLALSVRAGTIALRTLAWLPRVQAEAIRRARPDYPSLEPWGASSAGDDDRSAPGEAATSEPAVRPPWRAPAQGVPSPAGVGRERAVPSGPAPSFAPAPRAAPVSVPSRGPRVIGASALAWMTLLALALVGYIAFMVRDEPRSSARAVTASPAMVRLLPDAGP